MKNQKLKIVAALATVTFGSIAFISAPATGATNSPSVDSQASKSTTANGTKSCGKGDTVRLNVTYRRGLPNSKLIYNISRTAQRSVELPPFAGDPTPTDFYPTLQFSTFQQKSSYYASVPKGKEDWVKIKAVCV